MIRGALAALALAFALAHVPYLVSSLEDIDSVNFALGVRDFDVAEHRPHPPGYPIYIALGKAGVPMVRAVSGVASPATIEARTLSVIALIGAMVVILVLYRVLTCLRRADDEFIRPPWSTLDPIALAATALTIACPLFWYLGVRPMSDVPGLAAALAAQAALALAWWRQQRDADGDRRLAPERIGASGRMIVLGALLAGLAIGFRSQNAFLTVPLLFGVLVDRIGRGVAGAMIGGAVAFSVGVLAWAVPLVVASGGWTAYLGALGSQAGEDFAGAEMLYLNPAPRLAAFALMRTLIFPWDSIALGSVVIALAAVGVVALFTRDRRALAAVGLLTIPYLIFHLLFQDTHFVRYALPLVPAVAFLAVHGLTLLARRAALPATGLLALWAVATGAPTLAAYASQPSPTAMAFAEIRAAVLTSVPATSVPATSVPPTRPGALALHQTFRRPLEADPVPIARILAAPPRREWLELVRYWRDGHIEPVWFLADPRRSDLALIDPRSRADRTDFAWPFTSLSELGGIRPLGLTWYRLPAPGWFAEEGWALTPETAGIARVTGQGPAIAPITAWVRRRNEATMMLIGGRHLGATGDGPVTFRAAVDGREVAAWEASAGFFVREIALPAGALSGDGPLARLTLASTARSGKPIATAIEQFDLQSEGALMWAYDEGWHEAEYNPAIGMWRWTSNYSTLRILNATTPIAVTIRVEQPNRYFDQAPQVRLKTGDRVVGETRFDTNELWSVIVPLDALQASGGRLTIETDEVFVPADRDGGDDQRRLSLRIFGVNIAAQR
ncbi:MAG TPA: DUF2723 domain-containing protein [Vicinamibacterales bacterium]|nr:DUF2723 domain-containing protein [Vicinamibacterales bacterium]